MGIYETESGYKIRETLSGLEVTEDDKVVCEIGNKTLDDYRYCVGEDDEYSEINDDLLEADIKENIETEDFLAYQREYC